MSFFTSGSVDVRSVDRSKLPEGTYRVVLVDFADHLGAFKGSRTQCDFRVIAGPSNIGTRKAHFISHATDASWKAARARGEIATILGAFSGMDREKSGLKVDATYFQTNTRTVNYVNDGKDVGTVSRGAEELPLVQKGAEAFLVVRPYFKNGKRHVNVKTGEPSVIMEFYPLSAGLTPTTATAETESFVEDDAPEAPEVSAPVVDAMELAAAAGWKPNPNAPGYFYAKGEAKQLKEADLRAKFTP